MSKSSDGARSDDEDVPSAVLRGGATQRSSEICRIPLGCGDVFVPLRCDFVGVVETYTFLIAPCGYGNISRNATRRYV